MNIVQQSTHAVTLIVLEVVIIVELWRGEEWKMVAGVRDRSGHQCQAEPDPDCHKMTAYSLKYKRTSISNN